MTGARARRIDRDGVRVGFVLLLAPFAALSPEFVSRSLFSERSDALDRLPELVHSARALLSGEVLWTAGLWLGQPLLGDANFSTFYPPKLLLLIGNPFVAYAGYLILHHLLAEVGAYFYAKRIGCGRLGALFGALAYAYAGFMLDVREQGTFVIAGAWLPWVFVLIERAVAGGSRAAFLGAAVAFAMVPFSGALELTAYFTGVILLFSVARSVFEEQRRSLLSTLLVLGPALLVSALELVPSWAFLRRHVGDPLPAFALTDTPDPLLLPTLYLPLPPSSTTLYMRAGVAVLCASAVAVNGFRVASALVKAWAVVLAAALAMMLARHLPPIARLLHDLPIVGGERGARHDQAALGLAFAVLGACGVERARNGGGGSPRRWFLVGAAVTSLSWLALWIAGSSNAAGEDAVSVWQHVSWLTLLGAALPFLIWILALTRMSRPQGEWAWTAVAVLPLFETAWAVAVESDWRRPLAGTFEVARSALPPRGGVVRLLSPPAQSKTGEPIASGASFAGNSVLLHRDAQGLRGTTRRDPLLNEILETRDASYPLSYAELAYSVLPSVFGVTHVVLPNMVCDRAVLALAADGEPCSRSSSHATATKERELTRRRASCTGVFTDAVRRYELEAEVRAAAGDGSDVAFEYRGGPVAYSFFDLPVPGASLGREFRRYASSISLLDATPVGTLAVSNQTTKTIEFRQLGIQGERDSQQGAPLDGAPQLVSSFARGEPLSVPSGATIAALAHLPVRPVEVVLDARAGALEGPLSFGLDLPTTSPTSMSWAVASSELAENRRTHHIALLPPDLREASLFVDVRDAGSVLVRSLTAADACTRRNYENPLRLDEGLFLYENRAALPRVYVVGQTIYVANTSAARRALYDFEPEDLGMKAVVSEPMPPELRRGTIQESRIATRRADVVVRSDEGPTLLVLNDRYDPDWHASIGGTPTHVLRVNGMVRGVVVPRGTHHVTFFYTTPSSVWIGLALAVAGLLGALFWAPVVHRRLYADAPDTP